MYVCMHVQYVKYIHTCVCVCLRMYVCMSVVFIHICMYICMEICVCMYMELDMARYVDDASGLKCATGFEVVLDVQPGLSVRGADMGISEKLGHISWSVYGGSFGSI